MYFQPLLLIFVKEYNVLLFSVYGFMLWVLLSFCYQDNASLILWMNKSNLEPLAMSGDFHT